MRPEEWILGLLHTALHHLRQRLHRCLLSTLEPGLGEEGADHHLQGPSPGQMVVLCRAGGCFTATPALETHLITCDWIELNAFMTQSCPVEYTYTDRINIFTKTTPIKLFTQCKAMVMWRTRQCSWPCRWWDGWGDAVQSAAPGLDSFI